MLYIDIFIVFYTFPLYYIVVGEKKIKKEIK